MRVLTIRQATESAFFPFRSVSNADLGLRRSGRSGLLLVVFDEFDVSAAVVMGARPQASSCLLSADADVPVDDDDGSCLFRCRLRRRRCGLIRCRSFTCRSWYFSRLDFIPERSHTSQGNHGCKEGATTGKRA